MIIVISSALREEKKLSQGDIEKRTGSSLLHFRVENGHTVRPSRRWKNWHARSNAHFINCSTTVKATSTSEPPQRKSSDDIAWGSPEKRRAIQQASSLAEQSRRGRSQTATVHGPKNGNR